MRPIFSADWPRYAVAAHLAFWGSSALIIAGCLGAYAGAVRAEYILWLLAIWIVAGFLLGLAAAFSGRLYIATQVFARRPITGWAARAYGIFAALSAAILMLLAYGATQIRGV